jgi:hypothetical protein
MPRTAEEILDQADELANRFETHEPDPNDVMMPPHYETSDAPFSLEPRRNDMSPMR